MRQYIKYFFREISDDNIDSMSSSIAYAFMLSLFPFLIGVFAVLQILDQSANIVQLAFDAMDDLIPEQVRVFVLEALKNVSYERTGSILVVSLVASIGFGSYGFKTIFAHLSRIMRDKKPRSFIWLTIVSIIFAAAAIIIIAISSILLIASNDLIYSISGALGISSIVPKVLNTLRYPVVFLFLIISAGIVYRIGPKRKIPLRSIFVASFLFSVGWMIATFLFGLYVSRFGAYNVIFGTLTGVIIFLMWMYLSAFIFLSSAEIGRMHMDNRNKKNIIQNEKTEKDKMPEKNDSPFNKPEN